MADCRTPVTGNKPVSKLSGLEASEPRTDVKSSLCKKNLDSGFKEDNKKPCKEIEGPITKSISKTKVNNNVHPETSALKWKTWNRCLRPSPSVLNSSEKKTEEEEAEEHEFFKNLATQAKKLFDAEAEKRCSHWKARSDINYNHVFEKIAHKIFDQHTQDISNVDLSTSGVEWWVQVRSSEGDPIGFHWDEDYLEDKDEIDLAKLEEETEEKNSSICNNKDKQNGEERSVSPLTPRTPLALVKSQNLLPHHEKCKKTPYVATVTYLTNLGPPTVVLEQPPVAKSVEELEIEKGVVSFPEVGKHLAFRGDFLHGVPSGYMHDEVFFHLFFWLNFICFLYVMK